MKRLGMVCAILGMMAWIAAVALMGFEQYALDASTYQRLQRTIDVYEDVGVNSQELDLVMEDISGYLRGERDNLDRQVVMFGQSQPIFNEREVLHMQDVQRLFHLERVVRNVCLVAGALLLSVFVFVRREKRIRSLFSALAAALGIWGLLGAGIFVLVMIDFSGVFDAFHRLLFTNDLWQLDPATDAMIRMFPLAFFEQFVVLIAKNMFLYIMVYLTCVMVCLWGVYLLRRWRERT